MQGFAGSFCLDDTFLQQYKEAQPKWGPLGEITYRRTYSRLKDDGQYEEFWETLKRVVEGTYRIQRAHCSSMHLPWSDEKAQRSAQEMYRRMWEFKFLPPGRGLWSMGSPVIEKLGSMPLYNCAFVTTEDMHVNVSGPFTTLMDELMLGVGVGFDTLGAGEVTILEPSAIHDWVLLIPDTREGWCLALKTVIDAYTSPTGSLPIFDYSQIRPAGAPIKTFGGTASGPAPLRELINSLILLFSEHVGEQISSTILVDIFNHVGKCVVSGNVRRSAELALGVPGDAEFFELKDPVKHKKELESHRWASNNAVAAFVGMDYSKFAKQISQVGDPGLVWLDNCKNYGRMGRAPDGADKGVRGTNPCGEIALESRVTPDGVISELCNLTEVYPAHHDSYEDYQRTLKFAYLYNKTVTLVPTHNPQVNTVIMRNRRIGTATGGVVQAIQKHGRRTFFNWCDQGYAYLRELDDIYSNWLAVPKSIKITTCKPSGSVALLSGATPGIHFPHAEYYIRRIRFAADSPLLPAIQQAGYCMEPDVATPNTTVVEFPVHEEHFDRAKTDVSMWEQLELVAQMQEHWADNAVSVTVTFRPEEASQIKYALELYETRLKSVSFLPHKDHCYAQVPYETITKEEYEKRMKLIKPINFKQGRVTHEVDEKYCTGDVCLV